MTKSQLIDSLTQKMEGNISRKDAELIVNILFQDMGTALKNGDKIEIRGVGSFKTVDRRNRLGRNPKTGEKVDVAAKKAIFFKPGKELKERVDS